MTVNTEGKRTPLYAMHCQLGARMIQFGGWEMPVSYRGIVEEHQRVRTHAGLLAEPEQWRAILGRHRRQREESRRGPLPGRRPALLSRQRQ